MFNIILVRPSINLISMSNLLTRKIFHKQLIMKVRTFFLPYQSFFLITLKDNKHHKNKHIELDTFN